MLQLFKLPSKRSAHVGPNGVECIELGLGLDDGEELAVFHAAKLLEESVKDVVVVEHVRARGRFVFFKGALNLDKERIQCLYKLWPRRRRCVSRDAVHDLQPPLDPILLVQRSEYRSHSGFVESGVAASLEAFSDIEHIDERDLSLEK